jgi:hypothetical protein
VAFRGALPGEAALLRLAPVQPVSAKNSSGDVQAMATVQRPKREVIRRFNINLLIVRVSIYVPEGESSIECQQRPLTTPFSSACEC